MYAFFGLDGATNSSAESYGESAFVGTGWKLSGHRYGFLFIPPRFFFCLVTAGVEASGRRNDPPLARGAGRMVGNSTTSLSIELDDEATAAAAVDPFTRRSRLVAFGRVADGGTAAAVARFGALLVSCFSPDFASLLGPARLALVLRVVADCGAAAVARFGAVASCFSPDFASLLGPARLALVLRVVADFGAAAVAHFVGALLASCFSPDFASLLGPHAAGVAGSGLWPASLQLSAGPRAAAPVSVAGSGPLRCSC